MGSGAFLNEAVNQLADAYLERKQHETGRTIPARRLPAREAEGEGVPGRQPLYGVDLNPVAIELAEVSLWLNTIYPGSRIPWFGRRLAVGNSLIGARRQVFPLAAAHRRGAARGWTPCPSASGSAETRRDGYVYHFLVPDKGMAGYERQGREGDGPDEIKRSRTGAGSS